MAKEFLFEFEARQALQRGLDQLVDAVKVTLGPRGRNVVLDRRGGTPMVTNDGVTIAKEIELVDPFENLGAQLGREVTTKTQEVAGDGTTTAAVLAQALVREGLRAVTAGSPPMALKRGMDRACAEVVKGIRERARQVRGREDFAKVATLAANQDAELGGLIAEALDRVGRDGVVTVEEGKGTATTLEVVDGMQFDQGYASPYFVTDPERMETPFENAAFLLVEGKINTLQEIMPVLEQISRQGSPLVLVAEDFDSEVLAALVVNRLRGTLDTVAVKSPAYGERRRALLEDLAVVTGGVLVSPETGRTLDTVKLAELGKARRVVVGREKTTVIGGQGRPAEIRARCDRLRREIAEAAGDYDREALSARLARLGAGVGILRVGALTEVEMKEKKARAEDAIAATRAAVEGGVIPGGGVMLLRAAQCLDRVGASPPEQAGVAVVRAALVVPLAQIATNAGEKGDVIVERVREATSPSHGYNAVTGMIEDLEAAGVLDPAKVVCTALQNAVSIAGLILTTETLVAEEPPEAEPPGPFS